MAPRRPYKVLDRSRSLKKGVMAGSLAELLERAGAKLGYTVDHSQLLAVLEEDGTEVGRVCNNIFFFITILFVFL